MRVRRLRLENLRCFADAEVVLSPGMNVFLGANGAGKTTLLEATYLLSHARSFRSGPRDAVQRLGGGSVSVFAEIETVGDGPIDRLGLARIGGRWQARVNGETPAGLEGLLRRIRVVCFEPGSHGLIAGPGEERRRFLDWTLFHVERDFLSIWRQYHRALKQRNALLRSGEALTDSVNGWNLELCRWGERLAEMRQDFIARWSPLVEGCLEQFLPELGSAKLKFSRGWPAGVSLIDALVGSYPKDLLRGGTSSGPHRADWELSFSEAPRREHLSRGQAKLAALACVLSQAQVLHHKFGRWPVICLDDFGSELDSAHQTAVLRLLGGTDAQILLSGVEEPAGLSMFGAALVKFHVELGGVKPLLLL